MNEVTVPPSEIVKQSEVKLEPELTPESLAYWGMGLLPEEFKTQVYGQYPVESNEYKLAQTVLESMVGMLVYDMLAQRVTSEQEKADWVSKIKQQQPDQSIKSSLLEFLQSQLNVSATNADSTQSRS